MVQLVRESREGQRGGGRRSRGRGQANKNYDATVAREQENEENGARLFNWGKLSSRALAASPCPADVPPGALLVPSLALLVLIVRTIHVRLVDIVRTLALQSALRDASVAPLRTGRGCQRGGDEEQHGEDGLQERHLRRPPGPQSKSVSAL